MVKLLKNPHLQNLGAIVRIARTKDWRKRHPKINILGGCAQFERVFSGSGPWDKLAALQAFNTIYMPVVMADRRLFYSTDDVAWFIEQLDEKNKTAMTLLMAMWSVPHEVFTPQEIAERTDTSASSWRNKAANYEIPGAVKKGRTWLIPETYVMSQGYDLKEIDDDPES